MAIFSHTVRKNRNTAEVYASLLRNAAREETGTGITKLMYTSFLSYRRTTVHLEALLRERLLEYDESTKLYKITPKGREFLEIYTKMAEILEPIT
jgi:predicted transcriptional regulator